MPLLALLAVLAGAPLSDPVPGPAPRNQYGARAVSNGEDYLVVWTDPRTFPMATYATRMTASGEVLDRMGIRLVDQAMFAQAMVWSGTSYVIAWSDVQNFWLMRVDRDGAIVDGPRIVVQGAQPGDAAFDGSHIVISYFRDIGINREPHALFLTPDAEIVKDVKLADASEIGPPMLAWNGSQLAAAWLAFSNVYGVYAVDGVRFTIDGTVGAVTRLLDNTQQLHPRIASDGRDFLLLMYDDNIFNHVARHVSADLAMVGNPVVMPAGLRDSGMVLWAGDHYVVTGENGPTINAVRLDRNGQLLDAQAKMLQQVPYVGSAPGSFSATNGRDLLVTWSAAQDSSAAAGEPFDIYATTASGSTLQRTSSELVSIATPRQVNPLVASSGSNLLTLWQEDSGLYARRNALDGRALDAAPIRIATRAENVSVTFDGAGYVVAWSAWDGTTQFELVTRRIAMNGALQASGGTRITTPTTTPLALASDGETTLLAWASSNGVQAARLTRDATLVDTVPLTLTSDGTISALSLAPNDAGEFLVAWGTTFFTEHGGMNPLNVLAARVTSSLTNLDARGFFIASTTEGEGYPSVAWNGSEWLVVWQRGMSEIRGRRIARNGMQLDVDFDGLLIAANAKLPVLAWNGAYTLAWTAATPPYPGPNALYAARFAQPGGPLTGVTRLGESEIVGQRSAFLADVHGRTVVAYARIAREPEFGGVMRAFLTQLDAPRRRASRH